MVGHASGLPGPYTRKIDLVDGKREIPMKILCLGYSRTGTLSLYTALQMLGYRPYHMAEAIQNADVDMPCWAEGIEAKLLGKGKPWGREEFDKLTGKHDVRRQSHSLSTVEAHCGQAVLDVPCILFVEEMIAAYPDAKVILTERPVEGRFGHSS
jgi:Sulfotransferase domain